MKTKASASPAAVAAHGVGYGTNDTTTKKENVIGRSASDSITKAKTSDPKSASELHTATNQDPGSQTHLTASLPNNTGDTRTIPKPANAPARAASPNPFSQDPGPTVQESMGTMSSLPSAFDAFDCQRDISDPAIPLVRSEDGMMSTPATTTKPTSANFNTPLSKRKHQELNLNTGSTDRDDEESLPTKKNKIELAERTRTPLSTPMPSDVSNNVPSSPLVKAEAPAEDHPTEEGAAHGYSQAKRRREKERAELAKKKRELQKQYELAQLRIKFDYDMEELEAKERLMGGADEDEE